MPNSDPSSLALVIEFAEPPRPVVFTDLRTSETPLPYETKPPTQNELAQLMRVAKKGKVNCNVIVKNNSVLVNEDALCSMTKGEKKLVWMYRYFLKKALPEALSKVLLSVSWHVRAYIKEVHRLLEDWEPLHVIYALEVG